MTYRVRSDRFSVDGARFTANFLVDLMPSGTTFLLVKVGVPVQRLAFTSGQVDEPAVGKMLATYALPRIEAGLRDGLFQVSAETSDGERIARLNVSGDEWEVITGQTAGKRCRYQSLEAGDLFCDAGADLAKMKKVSLPTSNFLCGACNMPDARVVCSRLHHVETQRVTAVQRLAVQSAFCDLGHHAKVRSEPDRCCYGGHDCWERDVEPEPQPGSLQRSPLALHEAIGYLDAVWLNVFKGALLGRDVLRAAGTLATACATSQDFTEKVAALVETFDAFQVPGNKGGTLDRMVVHLKSWCSSIGVVTEEYEPVEQAITVLKKVARLRAGLLHGDERARRDFEEAQRVLSISLPAVAYAPEWNQLVARVAGALAVVREFVRRQGQSAGPPTAA